MKRLARAVQASCGPVDRPPRLPGRLFQAGAARIAGSTSPCARLPCLNPDFTGLTSRGRIGYHGIIRYTMQEEVVLICPGCGANRRWLGPLFVWCCSDV